ncbi:hypothetical protein A3B52_02600 [Candidatus Curtissbacteria bacterium RIFCSPLOWO2_01_FULL_41_28]|uniref:DUF2292 domain-containing protein n=1 Tax=Candidatus Curtissbacteria bacterium RIFOXYA1_FULL_41_14 TaxID=1797737 RepID=A0A1F5HCU7_9BACT|nr:MAG: hypothetical protein UT95_C0064G0005 [Candidatus Curtissbacteria bacterium GW2011_GWB1_40_28]OGD96490.1 MAG: hypothetical protein A3B52_02600 [Candidatus Curtissbacteria bacterium RIFCSPLOWO2_01_FULL_41_28]OGE01855.1 MAG: hypothetical protein A2196_03025 [Candidatus Curtissbacteria bacterium RIFOXYA1_FULL_41_14]OGE15953.1 MAG: hypothetical protein A2409_04345 [Candidatus Curtissbacteria bacterium RIFOXYC1_FULL_41_36]
MYQTDHDYSTQKIKPQLVSQIVDALKNKAYGSVEIYIQNYTVTQITERTITKVNHGPNRVKKLLAQDQVPDQEDDKLTL